MKKWSDLYPFCTFKREAKREIVIAVNSLLRIERERTVAIINKRLDDFDECVDHISIWKSAIKSVINSPGTLDLINLKETKE